MQSVKSRLKRIQAVDLGVASAAAAEQIHLFDVRLAAVDLIADQLLQLAA